jgi:alpha-D-ribose 1-methylphosphonate 5-triphosphate synthase subunit PhnI
LERRHFLRRSDGVVDVCLRSNQEHTALHAVTFAGFIGFVQLDLDVDFESDLQLWRRMLVWFDHVEIAGKGSGQDLEPQSIKRK